MRDTIKSFEEVQDSLGLSASSCLRKVRVRVQVQVKLNLNDSNTDDSFTVAYSNSFSNP